MWLFGYHPRMGGYPDPYNHLLSAAMMIMLRDDPVIVVFDSPDAPPSWIEWIDIENGGVVTHPKGWFKQTTFSLRPEGTPILKNALDLIDGAELLEPNAHFPDLDSLRQHLTNGLSQ
jgi:hypothetical protein